MIGRRIGNWNPILFYFLCDLYGDVELCVQHRNVFHRLIHMRAHRVLAECAEDPLFCTIKPKRYI